MSYYNPFQNLELRIPGRYRDEVNQYCQTQTEKFQAADIEDAPFQRYVDLWFTAICLSARDGYEREVEDPHRFITGEILSRDVERIVTLELIAIAHEDDPWVIETPSRVMEIANRYAAAGLPRIIAMLREGSARPLWNLTDNMMDEMSKVD